MAELAPRHVAVERGALELQPGGHALDDRDQAGTVRLACGDEPEARAHVRKAIGDALDTLTPLEGGQPAERAAARIVSSGGSCPVQIFSERAPWRTSTSMPSTVAPPAASAAASSGLSRSP